MFILYLVYYISYDKFNDIKNIYVYFSYTWLGMTEIQPIINHQAKFQKRQRLFRLNQSP